MKTNALYAEFRGKSLNVIRGLDQPTSLSVVQCFRLFLAGLFYGLSIRPILDGQFEGIALLLAAVYLTAVAFRKPRQAKETSDSAIDGIPVSEP